MAPKNRNNNKKSIKAILSTAKRVKKKHKPRKKKESTKDMLENESEFDEELVATK